MDIYLRMVIVFLIFVQSQVICAQIPDECQGCGCCAYGYYNKCDNNGYCNNGCQDGYWGEKCYKKCKYTNCLRCARDNGNTCECCKPGYFSNTGLCHQCVHKHFGCTCTNLYNCVGCIDGYFMKSNLCSPCPYYCTSCTSSTQCNSCTDSRFGYICQYQCAENCIHGSCVSTQAFCQCNIGYTGYNCDQCIAGYYGNGCTQRCSIGCIGSCNQLRGYCICQSGWAGDKCEACADNYFGNMCYEKCNSNCVGCTRENNISEHYGDYCQIRCGKDCMNGSCAIESGYCNCKNDNFITASAEGYCHDCVPGQYGPTCGHKCHTECLSCNQVNGSCLQCKSNSKYGPDCTLDCSNNCTNSLCDVNGNCTNGCISNMYGKQCENICAEYCTPTYNNTLCSEKTGMCLYGCESGYIGAFCPQDVGKTNERQTSFSAALGGGLGGCSALLIIIIIVRMFWFRKRRRAHTELDTLENNDSLHDARRDYDTVDTNLPEVEHNDLRRRSITEHNYLQNNDIVQDARRDYDTVDINLREVELNDLRYETLEGNEVDTMDQTADYSTIPDQENYIITYENVIGGL